MSSKALNILMIIGLMVAIGLMSWRDMHAGGSAGASAGPSIFGYYTGKDLTPAMIPDDRIPLVISQGIFSYTPAGKMTWERDGMEPALFPQRDVRLLFHFKNLPSRPEETIKKIDSIIKEWERMGTTPSLLILDYTPEKPDLKSYTTLLEALAAHFANASQQAAVGTIRPDWLETAPDILNTLHAYQAYFIIPVPENKIPEALVPALKTTHYNIVLQYPGSRKEDLPPSTAYKEIPSVPNVMMTLTPGSLPPKKRSKVGLFPKF